MENDGSVDPQQRDDCEVCVRACSCAFMWLYGALAHKGLQISALTSAKGIPSCSDFMPDANEVYTSYTTYI